MEDLDRRSLDSAELEVIQGDTALPTMVRQLTRLGCQLDMHGTEDDVWGPALRTLFQVSALGGYRLVAVAGGQGAGKTTLVRNLYPDAAEWLVPNPGRGEKNPIAVVEVDGLTEPRGIVLRRVHESTEVKGEEYGVGRLEEWQDIIRGKDNRVLMVRLEVPLSLWGLNRTGLILLPGFEHLSDDYWQTLMRIVLVTSPAAVVVTDAERMANATQQKIVDDVRTATIQDAAPVQVVVALNRCDGKPPEEIERLADEAVRVYGVRREWVVPVGADDESPPGWTERFTAAVRGILPDAAHARRHEVQLLREVVRTTIAKVITVAHGALDRQFLDSAGASQFDITMAPFDAECENLLCTLDEELRRRFSDHLSVANNKLDQELEEADNFQEIFDRFGEWLTLNSDGKHKRLAGIVENAWDPPRVQQIQRECLDAVRDAMRSVVTGGTGVISTAIFRPLISFDEIKPNDTGLLEAIRMLPMMALETRSFTVGMANSTGRIDMPSGEKLESGVVGLSPDKRAMLIGAAVLLGADLAADGDLDAPSVVAEALATLLTGGTAGGAAMGPALLAVAAVGLSAAAIHGGNRAIKERGRIGHIQLKAHQVATVEHIRGSVVEILRLTREVLASRLRRALRLDDTQIRQFALLQAIRDTERARNRMLEVLGGEHVA